MNAGPDVERLIATWLDEEAPVDAPDRILESAAHVIDRTRQRRLAAAWREPMTFSIARLVAALAVLVVVGAGAMWLGRSGAGVGAPSPSPSPTPTEPTLQAFRAEHDAICAAAKLKIAPLNDQLGGIYDAATTSAERTRKTDLLEQIGARTGEYTSELEALQTPTQLGDENAADVARHRAVQNLIAETVASLRSGKIAEAQVSDKATDPLSRAIEVFEHRWGLVDCP